jgi:DNA-directed RNA polymerase specialized sigma24 family protein
MSKNTVNQTATPHRRTGAVENDAYHAFTRRVLRAYSRRVAAGDVEALAALVSLGTEVEQATRDAVIGLREFGYSWSEIGTRLGMTKQAVHKRWGR